MTALGAAYTAGLQAWGDPTSVGRARTLQQRVLDYQIAWLYYRNKMFSSDVGTFADYLEDRGLYQYTRLIFNPVPQVVGFYEDHVFPAPANVRALEDGTQLVTAVMDTTPDDLTEAIAQLDQWGNWQSESYRAVRFCGATGNVLIEGVDDLEREKITHDIRWPGVVKDLVLDAQGNVKSYAVEYRTTDSKGEYTYRKEVTAEEFRYYRDDQLFTPEGRTAAIEENPYGFVFAVWVKHIDDGSDYGCSAVWNIDKVDELNSLASHAHDHIHKLVESPKVLATKGSIVPITGADQTEGEDEISPHDTRRDWMLLKAPEGTSVLDLSGTLKLAEADPYIARLLESFSADYPELQAHEVIKQNSQLSGAALERMLGPAQAKLDRACANYFQQIIKLRQMGVAIAGWRVNKGGWKQRTEQQKRFQPFGLESYAAGQLNFGIKRSLLVEATEAETEELLTKKATRAVQLEGLIDEQEGLRIAGYSDEQAEEIVKRRRKVDVIPTEDQ